MTVQKIIERALYWGSFKLIDIESDAKNTGLQCDDTKLIGDMLNLLLRLNEKEIIVTVREVEK